MVNLLRFRVVRVCACACVYGVYQPSEFNQVNLKSKKKKKTQKMEAPATKFLPPSPPIVHIKISKF